MVNTFSTTSGATATNQSTGWLSQTEMLRFLGYDTYSGMMAFRKKHPDCLQTRGTGRNTQYMCPNVGKAMDLRLNSGLLNRAKNGRKLLQRLGKNVIRNSKGGTKRATATAANRDRNATSPLRKCRVTTESGETLTFKCRDVSDIFMSSPAMVVTWE